MVVNVRVLQLLASVMLGLGVLLFDVYSLVYVSLVLFMLIQVMLGKNACLRIVSGYLLVYLGIALLNITDYRNDVSLETIRYYGVAILALLAPLIFFPGRSPYASSGISLIKYNSFFEMIVYGHLLVVWAAVFYVYSTKGFVIIHQDLRFGIPTAISYAIKSCQYIPFYYMLLDERKGMKLSLTTVSFLSILPTLLIASRATAILVVLAMVILVVFDKYYYRQVRFSLGNKVSKMFAGVGLLSVLFVAGGFYLRREFSDDLLTGSEFIDTFFGGNRSWYIYLLAPFHQGFNETASLTSRIVDYNITNSFTNTPLLFADFDNLFGFSSVAAAQFFGDDVGRVGDGGLTPGLVGGVLLDYDSIFFWVFLLFGVIFKVLDYLSRYSKFYMAFLVLYLVQFLHLFHRGFVKPEYITIMLIAGFYFAIMSRFKRPAM